MIFQLLTWSLAIVSLLFLEGFLCWRYLDKECQPEPRGTLKP